VKVRIAVIMNDKGQWSAFGHHGYEGDDVPAENAAENLEETAISEQVSFVEVDIPIPTPQTVVGRVVETREVTTP
jgi:hypothetical protein